MSRRAAGTIFVSISAFLFGVKYLCASIFGSNVTSWNLGIYQAMLDSIGPKLSNFSVFSLIIGIIYLVWAESDNIIKVIKEFKSKL